MKKSIRITPNIKSNTDSDKEEIITQIQDSGLIDRTQELGTKRRRKNPKKMIDDNKIQSSVDFSISGLISILFIIFIIVAICFKFFFPTVNSIEASITNKKVGKSLVYNYFNLLKNSQFTEALKLLDVTDSDFNINSLMSSLDNQIGSTNIVDCNILNVTDKQDYSIVDTLVSYNNNGKIQTTNQSLLVKDTPKGWKISLNDIIKSFKLDPISATFDNSFSVELDEIEYCVEGINLKLIVENNTYQSIDMKGNMTLSTGNGNYSVEINTLLKGKVKYEHNVLFIDATGDPMKLLINFPGKGNHNCVLPLIIKN